MSYLYEKIKLNSSAVVTEYTVSPPSSGTKTLYNGDKIIFDVPRSTGSSTVSIDLNGDITLASNKEYWFTMSVDVVRTNNTATFSFAYYDQAGNKLDYTSGASESFWQGTGSWNPSNLNSVSSTLQFVCKYPTQTYSIRCTVDAGGLEIKDTSLIIVEA